VTAMAATVRRVFTASKTASAQIKPTAMPRTKKPRIARLDQVKISRDVEDDIRKLIEKWREYRLKKKD